MATISLPTAPPAAVSVSGTTVLTDTLWNTGPAALDAWMRNPPHAVLAQTVSQSIPGNGTGLGAISFDQTIRDNYGGKGTPNGDGYTAKVAGTYLVQGVGNLAWTGTAANTAGTVATVLVTNSGIGGGVTWATFEVPTNSHPVRFQHSVAALIPMNVGDYVQLVLGQNSGSAQPTGFAATGCRMSVRWIAL